MGQPRPTSQSVKERSSNFREVSLGYAKKVSTEEARRCPQCAVATCLPGCPLGVDIPGFIRLLRESDAVGALQKIKNENPFPAICGRVCTAPCEPACVFEDDASAIGIRALERYAADNGVKPAGKNKITPQFDGKKVAIVGSGPSAMMMASLLLKEKVKVVMFEAAAQPGGVLRYGIPEFRLPKNILDEQFDELISAGLDLHTNVFVGRTKPIQELIAQFDAVVLAVGAGLPDFANLPGENLTGVYYSSEFLMRLQNISKENPKSNNHLFRGSHTIVIGQGYSALDSARMAIRFGQQVDLIFEGLEEELGVSQNDLKDAIEEGLKIHTPLQIIKINEISNSLIESVECRRLEIVEEDGALNLTATSNPSEIFKAQTVVLAHGQKSNIFLSKVVQQLKVTEQGNFWVDEKNFKTSLDKVFAVGSVLNESQSIVESLASGKAAAQSVVKFLTS